MIHLPVLNQLTVEGYGMYPGTTDAPGLSIKFGPGVTLVVGANGLGKSTLVYMVFRLLSGPYELQGGGEGNALGGKRIEIRRLYAWEAQTFALRVTDGATAATATLRYSIADQEYEVRRRLSDLSLEEFRVIGSEVHYTTEDQVQSVISSASGINTFGEWILALRLLMFYFEDRRALVWDKSAQRQLLRILFLSPEMSEEWSRQFREILELDSDVRNTTYVLNKEERAVRRGETALTQSPEIRQQISVLEAAQVKDQSILEELSDAYVGTQSERDAARLSFLRAEQQLEDARRTRERLELRILETAFPSTSETARYIVAHLVSEDACLTCSSQVPGYAEELRDRLARSACPVCGSEFSRPATEEGVDGSLPDAVAAVERAKDHLASSRERRERAEGAYAAALDSVAELTARVSAREAELVSLVRRLPPEDADVKERRDSVAARQGRLASDRERLNRMRVAFIELQTGVNSIVVESADAVKEAFEAYASGFLYEECTLSWAIYRDRVGEGGPLVDFPSFQLDMTGASFDSPVRRDGPEFVSESQREFIDLSFKMALIAVAAGEAGSIIIDAPESSLDAVFAARAADVLTRFAMSSPATRLVVTSNLVDGDLIPELLQQSGITSPDDDRVVDLLEIAEPTAAVRQRRDEYDQVRMRIFARAGEL